MKILQATAQPSSEIQTQYLDHSKAILIRALQGKPYAVYLFGSHATGGFGGV